VGLYYAHVTVAPAGGIGPWVLSHVPLAAWAADFLPGDTDRMGGGWRVAAHPAAHALARWERGEQPGRNAVAREDEPQSNF